ncbi:MFS transporter [Spirillospora sp. NPDC047279]|uniref:MFS transporter n=1 Tax=Spirillospora sp. NPDC047279 TaxID=3155478 RepID=UPI0033DF4B5E
MSHETADRPARLARLTLADGITRTNMAACLLASFAVIATLTFVPAVTPYLLSDLFGYSEDGRGVVVGWLNVAAETVLVCTMAFYGALADRVGRRPVMVAGFAICAAGLLLMPFAGHVMVLLAFRVVFALGAAALTGMLSTIIADYAAPAFRGRAAGLNGIMNGLGAVCSVLLLVRLPSAFESMGLDQVNAARVAFALVSALILALAVILARTLSPLRISAVDRRVPLTTLVGQGVRAARDPGVALAYGAAFVSRADLAIVGSFLALWVHDHARDVAGMSNADAVARAGLTVAIAQTAALVGAPIFGRLSDRMSRQNAVVMALAIAGCAYLSALLISDPLGPGMIPVAVAIGLGEVAGIVSSGPLLAQQAPKDVRGSAYGVFALCGSAGILSISLLGGYLFDHWRPAAPFAVVGALGLAVCAYGLVVRTRIRPHEDAPPPELTLT